jgi:hypothetical protein
MRVALSDLFSLNPKREQSNAELLMTPSGQKTEIQKQDRHLV